MIVWLLVGLAALFIVEYYRRFQMEMPHPARKALVVLAVSILPSLLLWLLYDNGLLPIKASSDGRTSFWMKLICTALLPLTYFIARRIK